MKNTAAIKNDDHFAFEEVFREHFEKLYTYYLRKTKSETLAEELAQETFIKLWVYRKSLSEEIPIAAQIFRIAKTIFIDMLKKKKLQVMSIEDVSDKNLSDKEQHLYESKEFARLVLESIEKLPPIRKKVFKLSREQGYTHLEIAKQLAISPKSVNNHITKAIYQLRKMLTILSLIGSIGMIVKILLLAG